MKTNISQSSLPRLLRFHKRMEDGRFFTAAQVVRIVRAAKANPFAYFGQTLRNSWYGGASDVLCEWADYCQNEINRRGGFVIREANQFRIDIQRRKRIVCRCRWCGSTLPAFKEPNSRFCDDGCRRDYYN